MSYLPEIYQEFKQRFPEVAKAYDALAVNYHEWCQEHQSCNIEIMAHAVPIEPETNL